MVAEHEAPSRIHRVSLPLRLGRLKSREQPEEHDYGSADHGAPVSFPRAVTDRYIGHLAILGRKE
jgi:hypothetical protein